jgi:hypothetical protein
MDSTRFDGLIRNLGSTLDRRAAARGLFAGALAVALGGSALEADAKRRRRKRRKKRKKKSQSQEQPANNSGGGTGSGGGAGSGGGSGSGTGGGQTLHPGDFCQHHVQCPYTYKCDVAVNASNSDKTCCGSYNALCGAPNEDGDDTAPYCCVGYYCRVQTRDGNYGVCRPISEIP